jgi:integrase
VVAEEAARFLAANDGHRLSALFAVGVAIGLRLGELLALTWDDVDRDGGNSGCGGRCSDCRAKGWCSGRRSRPGRIGASRYRSPRGRRSSLIVIARSWSFWRQRSRGRCRA